MVGRRRTPFGKKRGNTATDGNVQAPDGNVEAPFGDAPYIIRSPRGVKRILEGNTEKT